MEIKQAQEVDEWSVPDPEQICPLELLINPNNGNSWINDIDSLHKQIKNCDFSLTVLCHSSRAIINLVNTKIIVLFFFTWFWIILSWIQKPHFLHDFAKFYYITCKKLFLFACADIAFVIRWWFFVGTIVFRDNAQHFSKKDWPVQ